MVAKLISIRGAGPDEPGPGEPGPGEPGRRGAAPATLYASVKGSGPPLVLLHGLFGLGSNLGGVARALAERFEVHQLDLPNHGRSPWMAPVSLSAMAPPVHDYVRAYCAGSARILGHSLGAKVAMQLALSHPRAVTALVAADMAPVAYPPSHEAVFAALRAVAGAAPSSRGRAAAILREHLEEDAVLQFLLLSLKRNESGVYRWRFNLKALAENYADLRAAPAGNPYRGDTLFVYGANSPYMAKAGRAAAKAFFPTAEFARIEDAGHWLHAEKPQAFNAVVGRFLDGSREAPSPGDE